MYFDGGTRVQQIANSATTGSEKQELEPLGAHRLEDPDLARDVGRADQAAVGHQGLVASDTVDENHCQASRPRIRNTMYGCSPGALRWNTWVKTNQ